MKDTLATLVKLQKLDNALRDMREAKAGLDALETENQAALVMFDEMLAQRAERIAETEAFYAEKEESLQSAEDDIRRSRTRLSNITSQRELNALNKELDTARRSHQQRTEEMLKLMQQLESAREDQQKKKTERNTLAAKMKEVEDGMRADLGDRINQASDINERREALREQAGLQLVRKYDRVAKARGGLAVADCAGGRCGGCNMAMRPQVFNKLQNMDSLQSCQYCQRMLVFYEGIDGAPAPAPETGAEA